MAEGFLAEWFHGPRQAMQPVFEELLRRGRSLGPDVEARPTDSAVLLCRNRAFARIQPATRNRIDLGIALGIRPARGRLRTAGGFAVRERFTHRIAIASLADIDDEVEHWLRLAYDEDAG